MQLMFVTGNEEKLAIARDELSKYSLKVVGKKLDLPEIQAKTIEEVAIHKAKDAFAIIGKPLFVVDAGLELNAFNGFPGPYTKYAENWFGTEGLIKLMKNEKDKSLMVTWSLAYCDNNGAKSFTTSGKGIFSSIKLGAGGNWFECLVIDNKSGQTLGEFATEKQRTEFWGPIWKKFGEWISNR